MTEQRTISEKSRRVAKNTLLLYFRMLLLMFIGLFTSRVVLKTLGVEDFGTYQVVYSAVAMFSVLSNSISSSISRFMAYELGQRDKERVKKVFSSAISIQIGLCIFLFILAETLGLWYLENKVNIPDGREVAAMWVFQTAVISFAIQLMSVPFNCVIVAHEDMKAYAWVSILEGVLKLGIALALYLTTFDRLKVYSVLMLLVAIIIRGTYSLFCRKHYPETRGRHKPDSQILKQMISLGGWSFTANGIAVINTQGVNLLSNSFFGVGINAVRGIAGQVENIVRQFITNFLTALNPLIIKTWAEGNKDYCFALVRKGCKFSFLIVLLFIIPFSFESDFILHIWLGDIPEDAPLFTCLAILCVMMDFMSNSMSQLMIANGKVSVYYIVVSLVSSLTFTCTYIAFRCGAAPQTSYYISASVLLGITFIRLAFTRRQCGFPLKLFFKEVAFPLALASLLSVSIVLPTIFIGIPDSILMHCTRIVLAIVAVCLSSYFIALTDGEKEYVRSAFRKFFHL